MATTSIATLLSGSPSSQPPDGSEGVHVLQGGVSKGMYLDIGVITITGNYIVADHISTVLVNAAAAIITLPAISYVSRKIKIIKINESAGTVTINCAGSDLIAPELATTTALTGFGEFVELMSITSSRWYRDTQKIYNYQWTIRTSAANNDWSSVTYGNGIFVAVATTGTGNRVMTSPDGISWTIRTSAADNNWLSVTYGNGIFVAVATTGTGNRVMTSPDGISWTIRTSAADNNWYSVIYGNGIFVAVATTGTGNRVMTSPDGISWTIRTSAANNDWISVTYGNGIFVAVANSGTGDRVMTSLDGISWTIRSSAADNDWSSAIYGNGIFVAVANSGTGDRVMTNEPGSF